MGNAWKNDSYVQAQRLEQQDDLARAQAAYENIANARLQNAARGEWSPWLALKQNVVEHALLRPAERGAEGIAGGYATGASDDRSDRWDQAMQAADLAAESGKPIQMKRFRAR